MSRRISKIFRKSSPISDNKDVSYTLVKVEEHNNEETKSSDDAEGNVPDFRKGKKPITAVTSVTIETEDSLSPLLENHEHPENTNLNLTEVQEENKCSNTNRKKDNVETNMAPPQREEVIDGLGMVITALELAAS